jgi:hypothetical protein
MCTLITSKGTDIDKNIANQNHATRTRTPKPGYLNLSNICANTPKHNTCNYILNTVFYIPVVAIFHIVFANDHQFHLGLFVVSRCLDLKKEFILIKPG